MIRPPSAVLVAVVAPTPEGVARLVERLTGKRPDLVAIRAALAGLAQKIPSGSHWSREDPPMPTPALKCDGAPTCPHPANHVHPGNKSLGEPDRYYCHACCPPDSCPEALKNRRL